MTETEKQQINEFRLKGLGYKAIGIALGLSRDSVRSYCKRNGLSGNGSIVNLNVEEMKSQNHICMQCGKQLKVKSRGRKKKFCSDKCRRIWWNNNQDKRNRKESAMYKYRCNYCGREFNCYGNKRRKFCSHHCYIESRFGGIDNGI